MTAEGDATLGGPGGATDLPGRARAAGRGWRARLREPADIRLLLRSDLFDPVWYVARYRLPADTGRAGAARHYLREGAFLGHDPGPGFDTQGYYAANPDVAEQGHPALLHYLAHGAREGRRLRRAILPGRDGPVPDVERAAFDPGWYRETHDDVRRAGLDPRAHFETDGWAEGRLGARLEALVLDSMLWRGLEARALHDLTLLMAGTSARERAVAAWALARWHAAAGDWPACRAALRAHDRDRAAQAILPPADAIHLGIQAALGDGELAEAQALADRLRDAPGADAALSRMTVALARDLDPSGATAELAGLCYAAGLAPLRLREGRGPPFERLEATAVPPAATRAGEAVPVVTVILPCFDAAGTLARALDGLRRQSWRALEILVVDDASRDGSAEIAARIAREDGRIRLLRRARSEGAYVARNDGLAAARGDFVTVHDADDWSHPEKIARQVRALHDRRDAVASISHWVRVGADLSMTRWRYEAGWVHRNMSSLMLRRELRETLGYWDRVRAGADTEYLHRIVAAHGERAVVDVLPGVPLAFGRRDATNLSAQQATHARSLLSGPRRSYLDAARQWHRAVAEAGGLHLPQRPGARPFHAPEALSPSDPPGPPSDYERIAGSDLFDAAWYREANADVRERDPDPVAHYLEHGGAEGRDPGPRFSSSAWRVAQDLDPGICPLLHYETEGRARGAAALPRFEGMAAGGEGPAALFCLHAAEREVFGAERSALAAMDRLATEGRRLVAVLPGIGNLPYFEEVRRRCVAVEIVPQLWRHMARPPRPETVALLRDAVRRHGAREVHVNTVTIDAPLAAARAEGCRAVLHVRELPAEDPDLCRLLGAADAETLRRVLLEEADAFVANAPLVARWLGCPDRTEVRLNEIDPRLFDLDATPRDPLRVALIGSNGTRKGVEDFLAVAQAVADRGGRARFLLVGKVSAAAERLRPWPENVAATGYRDDPVDAIAEADVVLSLSRFAEAFGRTVLEAMAAGRPVVAYRRGTPAELIEDGRSGFLAVPDDPGGVAELVLRLDGDRVLIDRIGAAARARAREVVASATASQDHL